MALNNLSRGLSQNYVSTLEPLLEKYAISKSIYRAYSDQKYGAYMLLKELGWEKPVDQIEFHHFEENRKLETLTVENTVSGVAGAAVTVDIQAADFTNAKTYARNWFNVILPSFDECTITNVDTSAEQITIAPKDATVAISLTAGDLLVIGGSNFGEGTAQPQGIVRNYTKRNGYTQIFKESFQASGTAMTDAASVDFLELAAYIKSAPAELGNTLVATCQADMDYRMAVQKALTMYFGQENDNSAVVDDTDANAMDGDITSTKGLYHVTADLGSTQSYITGTLSLGDFYTIGDILDREMVAPTTPVLHRMGRGQNVEREQLLAANNALQFQAQYTKDQINGKIFKKNAGKEVMFNYTDMTIGQYTFMASVEPIFTDNKGVGATGFNTPDLGFIIPMEGGKDARDGKNLDSICFRYKKLGGLNRMYQVWSTDETNDPNGYDIKRWQMRCDGGFQFFGANRFIKLEGS